MHIAHRHKTKSIQKWAPKLKAISLMILMQLEMTFQVQKDLGLQIHEEPGGLWHGVEVKLVALLEALAVSMLAPIGQ